jgi:hypothetical protein
LEQQRVQIEAKEAKKSRERSKQMIDPYTMPEFGFHHLEEKHASQYVKKRK